MAQKKAHEVDGWIARPDPAVSIVLLYGPDRGLVAERAALLAERSDVDLDDAFSVSRLDAAELDRQPGRLVDEAATVSMFAARRLVWVRGAGAQKSIADEIRILAEQPPAATLVLVEAGDLRKTAPLRSVVEAAPSAIALPCYTDEKRALEAVIGEELRTFRIEPDAMELLMASLGGDRLVVRSELRKLAIFLDGQPVVDRGAVEAVIADLPSASTDAVVDAVLAGRPEELERSFAKAVATGQSQAALLAMCRMVAALHLARAVMVERRAPASVGLSAVRPPLFGPRRNLAEAALARYSLEALAAQARRLLHATLETRRRPDLADAITRQTLLAFVSAGAKR